MSRIEFINMFETKKTARLSSSVGDVVTAPAGGQLALVISGSASVSNKHREREMKWTAVKDEAYGK
jgi:ethanolamine utilization protein EutA (predicted chaperonin)